MKYDRVTRASIFLQTQIGSKWHLRKICSSTGRKRDVSSSSEAQVWQELRRRLS